LKQIYFDNAATTPLHPKVFEKMKPFFMEEFGNPSSLHSFGRRTRVAIEEAREVVAGFINANAGEIYFTSGGTEANNFVIAGISKTELLESRRSEVITSKAEHHSVIDTIQELEKDGFYIRLLNVNSHTSVSLSSLQDNVSEKTSLVSLMHVNNETGSINDIRNFSSFLKQKNIFFHTDAVQSFGKLKIDVKELGVDSLTGSAHKINGPKGIGFAYVKSGTPLSPILFGGSQEKNRRGGTENVAGIVGLAEAIKIRKEIIDNAYYNVEGLRNQFHSGIKILDSENIFVNGGENALPYILSVTFNSKKYKVDQEAMLMFLDINGLAVSNGSACTSGTVNASHVMLASGYSNVDAMGTIRFSFGMQNTSEEVDQALGIFERMLNKFTR
jgi:cysteine desulfurase